MKKTSRILIFLLTMIMVLSMIIMTGCGKNTSKDLVVKVKDEKIYLNEAMYYILTTEANLEQYDQYYQAIFGQGIWDMEIEDGKTMAEQAKEEVMEDIIMTQILYLEGKKADLTIPAEMEEQFKAAALEMSNSLTEELTKITGLNEKAILNIQKKSYIANEFYKTIIEGLDINEDEIKSGISKEEYRQYNTEYLALPFKSYDEEGQVVELTEEEKTKGKETLEKVLEGLKSEDSFSEIAEEHENLKSSTANFIYEDESVDKKIQDASIKLKNDEITDEIIETEDGYYIIKMVDNDSDESYNAAVQEAIATEQQEKFLEKYEELKKDYTIDINDRIWDPIVIGKTTVNISGDSQETEPTETQGNEGDNQETEPTETQGNEGDETEGTGEGTEKNDETEGTQEGTEKNDETKATEESSEKETE